MGKRYVDHDSILETPNNKKRKTDNSQNANNYGDAVASGNPDQSPIVTSSEVSYSLTTDVVDGVILTDLCSKKWRCGKPIGKGSFGEIFLASDDILHPVTSANAKFVVKIEPHRSGPLFVEIHCLIKAGKASDEKPLPLGMPTYMASGGHYFGQTRYRFLILPRYDFDLHSIIRSRQVETKNILIIATQLIDILEHIHDCGYAHSDIKAENIMIAKCTYKKNKSDVDGYSTTSTKKVTKNVKAHRKLAYKSQGVTRELTRSKKAANSKSYVESSSSSNGNSDDSDFSEDFENLSTDEEDHDDDAELTNTSESDCESDKDYKLSKGSTTEIEFSGSNPVRACRMDTTKPLYADLITSHYLRRSTKKVNYCEHEADEAEGVRASDDDDEWGRKNSYLKRIYATPDMAKLSTATTKHQSKDDAGMHTEDRIHLIDFGLALKFIDSNGVHRPFVMDQRRAHDGTLEFTSRDAHMGAHSRRSDLECLAYNLIYWKEGFLPWKNEKIMSQPEQVHRMKEYFMTDIKQLYKKIYNVQIPTFIYEFLTHVSNLAYHDRPNYKFCREIFLKEFLKLGYKNHEMVLNVADLRAAPMRRPELENIENQNLMIQKMTDVAKMMKMGMLMPFCETPTTPNQISPKNLRSKATQNPKKRRAKFSWTEILSTDPDQIARQRAEKEFERDQCDQTPVRRYTGKPTYAIIETENRKSRSKLDASTVNDATENYIKGYTKPMMDVWRRRQMRLLEELQLDNSANRAREKPVSGRGKRKQNNPTSTITSEKCLNGTSAEDVRISMANDEALEMASPPQVVKQPTKTTRRRKSGLRHTITPTKKISAYRETTTNRRRKALAATDFQNTVTTTASAATTTTAAAATVTTTINEGESVRNNHIERDYCASDEYSNCSSTIESSEASQTSNATANITAHCNLTKGRRKYNSSCGMSSPASEEDSRDSFDYRQINKTRCIRTRGAHSTSKPLVISDEDSRDTTDYSPVKNRHKRNKDNRSNSKKSKRTNGRGVSGRKISSDLIRTFTRG